MTNVAPSRGKSSFPSTWAHQPPEGDCGSRICSGTEAGIATRHGAEQGAAGEDQGRSHMVTTDAGWFVAPWGLLCVKPQKYLERLCRRLEDSYEHTGEPEQELGVIDMNVT